MNELIATYLFTNKSCPFPGVGTLSVGERTASHVLGEKQIAPPYPFISFSPADRNADDLIHYISVTSGISKAAAGDELNKYAKQLTELQAGNHAEIPHAGRFSLDEEGVLVFTPENVNDFYMPPVHAERIVHPESTHTIRVGDTESDSAKMTEYYSDDVSVKRSRWWLPALILLIIAIIAIIIYFSTGGNSMFGNNKPVEKKEAPRTYTTE